MSFDFTWANELTLLVQLLVLASLGYGAWICFRHAWKFGSPLDWKSADFPIPKFASLGETASPIVLSLHRRSSEGLVKYGLDNHSLCGNDVIDGQHQRLFGHTDELRAAIRSGRPVDEINAIIDALVREMVQHFQDEEAILAAAAYPEIAQHAALHRELLKRVGKLVGQFRAGRLGINELFRFLTHDVLAKHALDADLAFNTYSVSPA